ncbi:SDR family NAD(P)-dependent oxidoreductase [Leptospira montravelensis]|uniref:SDR family NAD(P)-dependent oxidoreductase n=1 Tax=Leptospira montravelensis TaxID=2484961 RepID=A0ABY2LNV5_9LEPT|nr:SDR family NAD(P)-dependent oxidoreductase [Leptospira montravelensis]TGK81118.1 SDR family NAD(P)-dependent oxidoreductase [Leptospira montravelensis]TGL01283.1 SDR family NAD(P)-dependent oxidoreductase [Leptospira montravelensis]
MDYKNKVILITGASSGIGRATALALAKFQNKIILTARRENLLQEVSKEITKLGSECMTFVGDGRDETHAEFVVEEIVKKYGKIDIALLNIGIGPPSNTLTSSAKTILDCMNINYSSLIYFYVPLMKQMKKQKDVSMISHMNSLATYFGIPMQGDYTASKGAARLFLETARMELEHFGFKHIRIQTIHPGFVDTEAVKNDGIPAPNQISENEAANLVLKGIRKEWKENRFPYGTALATRIGRIVPLWLRTKILLSETPKNF